MSRRVVVTGMGTLNALANDVEGTWESALEKRVGVTGITRFDVSSFTSRVAGEVKNFNFSTYGINEPSLLSKLKRMDNGIEFALVASKEALDMSGLDIRKTPELVGISIGCGLGGLDKGYENSVLFHEKGNRRISPFMIPAVIDNTVAGMVSMYTGAMGPNVSIQTACATSNHNITAAFSFIKLGYAEAMIAGGMNSRVHPITLGGFCNMRALSTKYNETPARASRPFDKDRDGFVMGEGAGILVLEEYDFAKKRGANILCELVSIGMSGDAYDIVAPHPEGAGVRISMKMALQTGKLNPEDIGYINMHGTSTPLGDEIEANVIHEIFGEGDHYWAGSTKSMHGHALGAAGGIEAVIAIKSLLNSKVPANVNLDEIDPVIRLKRLSKEVHDKKMKYVLSNSFGFGGHNSTLCFGKI